MTTTTSSIMEQHCRLIAEHRSWLKHIDPKLLASWEGILKSKPESAVAEAWVRKLMASYDLNPKPAEKQGKGGLDFICTACEKGKDIFYVEVANFDAKAIGKKLGQPEHMDSCTSGPVTSPFPEFLVKRRKKQDQVAKHQINRPTVLAFTCFQEVVSNLFFDDHLITELMIPQLNHGKPFFNRTLFFKEGNERGSYTDACPDISAVMICAPIWNYSSTQQPVINLVLNPSAAREFDPAWMPKIDCHKLSDTWRDIDPCQWQVCKD